MSKLKVIYIGPNCWGRGDSVDQAYRNMRKELPYAHRRMHRKRFLAFRVHPKTHVDMVDGGLICPVGHPPVKLDPVSGRRLNAAKA